jgi:hypothetical protein
VFAGAARPNLDVSGLYLTGAGLGAIAGLLLREAGYDVSAMGLAGTVTGGGLILALTTQTAGVLDNARTFAIGLGVVAAANLVLALRDDRRRQPSPIPSADTDTADSLELAHILGGNRKEVGHD